MWRERFLHSHDFSLRRPYIPRRPKPSGGILVHFVTDMQIAFEQYPRDRILNADETNWKILNNQMVTVGDCGSESVACEFHGNIKGCMTVIASIDASGENCPCGSFAEERKSVANQNCVKISLVKFRRINLFSRIKKKAGPIKLSPADIWTGCRIS
jgi:MoaA/NifB/PqqE/SkfB family radical SAM enzyme